MQNCQRVGVANTFNSTELGNNQKVLVSSNIRISISGVHHNEKRKAIQTPGDWDEESWIIFSSEESGDEETEDVQFIAKTPAQNIYPYRRTDL